MAWRLSRFHNLASGLTKDGKEVDPQYVDQLQMDLPHRMLGFRIDPEHWKPLPYNDKYTRGAVACEVLYINGVSRWSVQPIAANRQIPVSEQFYAIFPNPYRFLLVLDQNANPGAAGATFNYRLSNGPSLPGLNFLPLFPIDAYGFIRFTRMVSLNGPTQYNPHGANAVAGKTKSQAGDVRGHWVDASSSGIVGANPGGPGGWPANYSPTSITLRANQAAWDFSTILGVWRYNKGKLIEVATGLISATPPQAASASIVLTLSQPVPPPTAPQSVTYTSNAQWYLPAASDYYFYQVYGYTTELQAGPVYTPPTIELNGLSIQFTGTCSCLCQLSLSTAFPNIIPTFSTLLRFVSAKFRLQYYGVGAQGGVAYPLVASGAQGNVAVAYTQSPNDWKAIYDAGNPNGGSNASCYSQAANYGKVGDHYDKPNFMGVATYCKIKAETDIVKPQKYWDSDIINNIINDEYFDLDEDRDCKVIVMQSLNTVDAFGNPTTVNNAGCAARWYAFGGIEWNTNQQWIPTEEPEDPLIKACDKASLMNKHVEEATAGDYYWWKIAKTQDFDNEDEAKRFLGKHTKVYKEIPNYVDTLVKPLGMIAPMA